MPLQRINIVLLSSLVLIACGSAAEPDSLGRVAQAQDNEPESEPDRCTVTSDETGDNLGDGTIDVNGFCCVPESDGSESCYACGAGYTCSSIPSSKGPIKPPMLPPPPIRKR